MIAEPASVSEVMGGDTREGHTVKLEITDGAGFIHEGYITANFAADGTLREVFLAGFGKEGSTLDGWVQVAAILLSLALQAGSDFVGIAGRLGQMKFEPYGVTNDPRIPYAPSVPAYIVAWIALKHSDPRVVTAMEEVMAEWG